MAKEISHIEKEARKLSLLLLITADKAFDLGCPSAEKFAEMAKLAFDGAAKDRDMA